MDCGERSDRSGETAVTDRTVLTESIAVLQGRNGPDVTFWGRLETIHSFPIDATPMVDSDTGFRRNSLQIDDVACDCFRAFDVFRQQCPDVVALDNLPEEGRSFVL